MKLKSESIKKFVLIGLSLFLFKSVLIVYAYAFGEVQYNLFNQSYYTASLLILFGSLGFNISQTRIPAKIHYLFLFVTINIVITYLILHIISQPFGSISAIIPILIYSIFASAGSIMNFKMLFEGQYKKYFLIMFLFAIAHILVVPAAALFNTDTFTVLSFFIIIWFALAYRFFNKESVSGKENIRQFYKIGLSAFVINSAVSLALSGDKFIVNHFFAQDVANTYTFAWGLTAPIFYIGNLIEKYLYTEQKPDKNRILKRGFRLSALMVLAYSVFITVIVKLFPSVLPDSISKELFENIFVFMIAGYSLYVILNFPINTYLFKVVSTGKQKLISVFYSLVILLFVIVFYYIINYATDINYRMLLLIVWIYIFILLFIKTVIIFKKEQKPGIEPAELIPEDIQEIL